MRKDKHQILWWQDRKLWVDPGAHRSIVEAEALYNLLHESPRRIKRKGKLKKSVWNKFMLDEDK